MTPVLHKLISYFTNKSVQRIASNHRWCIS